MDVVQSWKLTFSAETKKEWSYIPPPPQPLCRTQTQFYCMKIKLDYFHAQSSLKNKGSDITVCCVTFSRDANTLCLVSTRHVIRSWRKRTYKQAKCMEETQSNCWAVREFYIFRMYELKCDAVQTGRRFLTFRKNLLPSSSGRKMVYDFQEKKRIFPSIVSCIIAYMVS